MIIELLASIDFPWYAFFAVLAFTWGACIGSYLNVCIYRIPRELSTVAPRSYCPNCNHPIEWYRNIPLISYALLRARCHHCHQRIIPRYFLVELLVATLFLLVWLKFDVTDGTRFLHMASMTDWKLVPIYWLLVAGLTLGTFVDFEHLIIPDRVTLGGIVAGIILSAVAPSLHGTSSVLQSLLYSAIGASVGWGLLWGVGFIGKLIFKRDAMGFGDVKLIGAIGAFLGWKAVLFTVMMSSLVGSLAGITMVLTGHKEMQSKIPYGPYLALAAVIWLFWGPAIWQGYLDFFPSPNAYEP